MLEIEIATALVENFRGREDIIALCPAGGKFAPAPVKPVPITPERFAVKHCDGSALGLYLLRPDNTVWNAAVDFDDHGKDSAATQKAQKFTKFMWEQGFPCYLEQSQSGSGAHVWFFFERPLAAGEVRVFLTGALEDAGYPGQELYPKQSRLTPDVPYGNLIRYPLSGKSCFLSYEDLSPQEPVAFLKEIKRISVDDLMRKAWWEGAETKQVTEGKYQVEGLPLRVEKCLDVDSLLMKRWMLDTSAMSGNQSKSELMFAVAQQLIRHHVPTPEVEAGIRYWCNLHGYEKGIRNVSRTVCKAYQSIIPLPVEITNDISEESSRLSVHAHAVIDSFATNPVSKNTFGITAVDMMFGGGTQQGWLSFIAGRPNEGKTATALQGLWALSQAGVKTAFFSLEMTEREVMERLLLRLTDRPREEWSDPEAIKELHSLWERRMSQAAPISFFRDAKLTKKPKSLEAILERMEMLAAEDHKCIIIDYIDKIDGCMTDKEGEISRAVSRFAEFVKEHNVDLRVLVQLKRPQDGFRGFRAPILSDVAGADRIGRDADLVLGVAEPWRTDSKKYAKDMTSFYWLKSRHGGCVGDAVVAVPFDSSHQTYSDAVPIEGDSFE